MILALIYSSFNLPQIRDVCRRVSYEISSSSWSLILDSFANILEYLLNKADSSANAAKITSMMDCLETIRLVFEHVLRVAPSHFGPIHFYGMIVLLLLLYLHSIKWPRVSFIFKLHLVMTSAYVLKIYSYNHALTFLFRTSDGSSVLVTENVHHLKISSW